jgi:site-specific recombinase XerD
MKNNEILTIDNITEMPKKLREFLAFINVSNNKKDYLIITNEFKKVTGKNLLTDKISYDNIIKWYSDILSQRRIINGKMKQFSPATINKRISILLSFFDEMVYRHLLGSNPLSSLMRKRIVKRVRNEIVAVCRVNDEMISKFLKSDIVPSYMKVAVLTIINTSVRISELLELQKSDFEMILNEDKYYYATKVLSKGNKYLTKTITTVIWDIIKDYIEEGYNANQKKSVWLITTERGFKCDRHNFTKKIKKKWQDIFGHRNVSTHDFRKFAGTRLAKMGKNLKYIQEFLGHKDISTTAKYYVVNENIPEDNEFTGTILIDTGELSENNETAEVKRIFREPQIKPTDLRLKGNRQVKEEIVEEELDEYKDKLSDDITDMLEILGE